MGVFGIYWILAMLEANKALKLPVIPGDEEYRAKARKAQKIAIVNFVLFLICCFIVFIIIFISIIVLNWR